MMFTQEYINQLENILGTEWVKSATNIEDKILFEIEQLKAKLESQIKINEIVANQRDVALEKLFEIGKEQQVRCTKDGEYPEVNQGVEWNVGVDAKRVGYFVGYLKSNHDISAWGDLSGLHEYDKNTAIYWQPLTSLKDQYERERGQNN